MTTCPLNHSAPHELTETIVDGHKIYRCDIAGKKFCEHMLAAKEKDADKFACVDCEDNVENCNCNECMGGVFCQVCGIVDTECSDVWSVLRKNTEEGGRW